jgi:hypothetical protein
MQALQRRWTGIALAVTAFGAAALSTRLWPPGLVALAIGAACAWPWSGRTAGRLAKVGLTPGLRTGTAAVILLVAAGANLVLGGQLDGHLMYRGDFQTYYVGAEVGLRHGWTHLFDQGLQRPTWTAVFADRAPFLPYLNTPPQAWLVTPLTALGFAGAFTVWVALMVLATLCAAWLVAPPTPRGRGLALLALLGLWVLAYSLAGGQNAILGALAIIACWRLVVAGKPGVAGVALALVMLRPNVTFLVPVALLVARQRRLFLAWLATSAVAGVVVLISLGPAGVRQFLELGAEIRRTHPGAVTLTVGHILGGGDAGVLAGLVLAALAMIVAGRVGPGRPDLAIAAGVLGSAFVTPYVHIQDYLAVLAAAAMVARTETGNAPGVGLVLLLLFAPPGSVYGALWPPVLLAVEVAALAWLGLARHADIRHPRSGPAAGPGGGRRAWTAPAAS